MQIVPIFEDLGTISHDFVFFDDFWRFALWVTWATTSWLACRRWKHRLQKHHLHEFRQALFAVWPVYFDFDFRCPLSSTWWQFYIRHPLHQTDDELRHPLHQTDDSFRHPFAKRMTEVKGRFERYKMKMDIDKTTDQETPCVNPSKHYVTFGQKCVDGLLHLVIYMYFVYDVYL